MLQALRGREPVSQEQEPGQASQGLGQELEPQEQEPAREPGLRVQEPARVLPGLEQVSQALGLAPVLPAQEPELERGPPVRALPVSARGPARPSGLSQAPRPASHGRHSVTSIRRRRS